MRKAQKAQVEEFVKLLAEAHGEIKLNIANNSPEAALDLLGQCQQGAIELGTLIENIEGEGFVTVGLLEKYCETVFEIYQSLEQKSTANVSATGADTYIAGASTKEATTTDADAAYQLLCKQLMRVEESVEKDIKIRREVVFLPYKASMWDSLESVWKAADADPDCDAYVIPIPYYDKNPDGSFKEYHYEGTQYPSDVPVVWYENYDFAERKPDVIFIHNPYDHWNFVTSVHPFFYSENLKKFTETLVYIPYYSTSGGMNEGQRMCPAYLHADYIIIQAEKFRRFFDAGIPQEKLVPLGTPKFDRVLKACNNPPEPPAEWKSKMAGKKVYFYNTSLNGMLANTPAFLKKMEYVFSCFMNREDACLLWRPHPLMESTFASMREIYKPIYDALKKNFVENELGIYDDTPDIADTIALSDAYIGDAGTSVTSLFGIAGKPLFILNNNINAAPQEEDWRGAIVKSPAINGDSAWRITQGNKLYHAPVNNFAYEYFCDLNEYSGGNYYSQVITINNKHYVCPYSAQDILLLETGGKGGIKKRIELRDSTNQPGAFCEAISCGKYLFLIPFNYSAIVRYDTESGELKYFAENLSVFIATVNGEKRVGGFCILGEYLFLASPADNRMLAIHVETGKEQILTCSKEIAGGCMHLASDGTELWMLPYSGTIITRWNPFSGEARQYDAWLPGMKCANTYSGYECKERPFGYPAFCGEYIYLPPYWGNMLVRLHKDTGDVEEWKPAIELPEQVENGYFVSYTKSCFVRSTGSFGGKGYLFYSVQDRKLYDVNLGTGEAKEIPIHFDVDELKHQTYGFCEVSEWLGYVCEENVFCSLADFLNGDIQGNPFDREEQIESFRKITANVDGTCGENVYRFVRESALSEKVSG